MRSGACCLRSAPRADFGLQYRFFGVNAEGVSYIGAVAIKTGAGVVTVTTRTGPDSANLLPAIRVNGTLLLDLTAQAVLDAGGSLKLDVSGTNTVTLQVGVPCRLGSFYANLLLPFPIRQVQPPPSPTDIARSLCVTACR